MASVKVSIGQANFISAAGGLVAVFTGPVRTETITSSGTSASGTLTANKGDIAQISCDTAVIANGEAAASASAGLYIPGGTPGYIGLAPGAVVRVIDA